MYEKAEVINLEPSPAGQCKKKRIQLESGRQILVHSHNKEELLEIVEPEGEVVMRVQLTDAGPVISIQGAHIKLRATETLSLESKKVKIKAEEEAVIESKGSLEIVSSNKLDIHSDSDIRIIGKMIYLN
jgi:phage repressor protein C with HTH and peptisase S24 domain